VINLLRRRQRGQTVLIAAGAMTAVIGAVALVVDTGMFYIVQRQFQTAADQGALAGAWYFPVCQDPGPVVQITGCHNVNLSPPGGGHANDVARQITMLNVEHVAPLCTQNSLQVTVQSGGAGLQAPRDHVNAIVVTVTCDAAFAFGQILNLQTNTISASAKAAMFGWDPPTQTFHDFPASCPTPATGPCVMARLIE